MDAGGGSGRAEAQRLLRNAEKLLIAHDLAGSKRIAERALESDPLIDGADQILAVVDVLLASQRRVYDQPDWYAVLRLPRLSSSRAASGDDSLALKRNFRRLALLLSPDRNKLPCANYAYRLAVEAFAVLSNPQSKCIFDAQLLSSNREASPPVRTFWTSCHACCHVFEYERAYVDRTLRCRICMRPFHAGEIAAAPPAIPGIDMFYCAWGFFPLGFPGSGFPTADAAAVLKAEGEGWRPFYPVSPSWGNSARESQDKPLNAVPVSVAPAKPNAASAVAAAASNRPGRSLPCETRKVVDEKRAGNYATNSALFGGADSEFEGLEAEGAGGSASSVQVMGGAGHAGCIIIDLDAAEDVLEDLHDVPFM